MESTENKSKLTSEKDGFNSTFPIKGDSLLTEKHRGGTISTEIVPPL